MSDIEHTFPPSVLFVGAGPGVPGLNRAIQEQMERLVALDISYGVIPWFAEVEFTYILTTFPLVKDPVKIAAQNAYRDVERGLIK